MANRIRTGDPHKFKKGRSSKFRESSRVQQTPEQGWRTYRSERCGNNNKDEDNSQKTLNDKNLIFLAHFVIIVSQKFYNFSVEAQFGHTGFFVRDQESVKLH